jgi:AcrR family transcriptional regulator
MPRHPDQALEGHILDAAYALWKRGGEKTLTMRAVAKAAGTTTPTVYERFRDKRDILEGLRRRAQQILFEALRAAKDLSDFPRLYLDFALKHRNEYELIHADWAVRFGRDEARPSFELLKDRLAEEMGGKPADYTGLALSVAALAHGTATLLLAEGVHATVSGKLRQACEIGFRALLEHAEHARKHAVRSADGIIAEEEKGRETDE